MKWLLVSPPKKGVRMFIESPPIGLGYLATTLRKLGHEVAIKDCIVDNWDNVKLLDYIKEASPDVVGFNVFSTALVSVKTLLAELKKEKHSPLIILGGPHCTGSPEHTLKYFSEADYAFRGEAEIPLQEFDEFLKGRRTLEHVTGLCYRTKNGFVLNSNIEYPNIDDFGFPAWDLINPRKYFTKVNVGDKSINVHFSRGCPFSCGFCVKLGTKIRFRSFPHIWEELDMLNAEYGVERFIINDEGFTMFPQTVIEFSKQAIARGNKYRYFTATGLRLNRLTDEMLQYMLKANFETSFGVGIESAVPRIREKLMHKALTQSELVNGLQCLNRNGFKPVGNFILGYPETTIKEEKESVKWACKMFDKGLLHGANFVNFLPLPGSPVVNQLLENGELSKEFDFSKLNLSVVCYAPEGSTIKEMDKLRKWAVWKLNHRPRMIWRYISDWGRFTRAVVTFIRIYVPNYLLPNDWKRF